MEEERRKNVLAAAFLASDDDEEEPGIDSEWKVQSAIYSNSDKE
jgi:hypothetical protein